VLELGKGIALDPSHQAVEGGTFVDVTEQIKGKAAFLPSPDDAASASDQLF